MLKGSRRWDITVTTDTTAIAITRSTVNAIWLGEVVWIYTVNAIIVVAH